MYNRNLAEAMDLFAPRTPYKRVGDGRKKKGQPTTSRPKDIHYRTSRKTAQKHIEVMAERAEEDKQEVLLGQARLGAFVLVCGAIVALLFSLVVSDAKLHSITQETIKLEKQIKLVNQDNEAMRRQFDVNMSDAFIEEYARTNLGLCKRQSCQTEWITLHSGDVFTYAPKSSGKNWISDKVDAFMAYLN